MSGYTLNIEGLEDFKDQITTAGNQLRPIFEKAMTDSVNQIGIDARNLAPFITGALRRSIHEYVQDGGLTGYVAQNPEEAPYGRAIEFGTVGMTINVPNGRRTKFGRTKSYSFIGTIKPNPYLETAFQQNIENVKNNFADAMQKVLLIMAGQA